MRELIRALRVTAVLWVLTAVIYPVVILAVGQVIFPFQANGSLLKNASGTIVGSALIGQSFTGDRYFWSRPSAVNYGKNSEKGASGASNLAPSNPALLERIRPEVDRLKQAGLTTPAADLVYTSGSGLDPHISVEAAKAQVQRVAQARQLNTNQVEILMTKQIEGPFLGIFGEAGVNVLKLNLALDQQP
jgi:potassium-transporting ATPase KdpC subunit